MVAPVPYESFDKRISLAVYAKQVAANYAQFFRQVNDAPSDLTRINVKNVRQAHEQALLLHKHLTEPFAGEGWQTKVVYLRAIRAELELHGVIWPDVAAMVADLVAVRNAAIVLSDHVKANVPEAYATVILKADGTREEVAAMLDKATNAVLLSAIADARSVFGADPKA